MKKATEEKRETEKKGIPQKRRRLGHEKEKPAGRTLKWTTLKDEKKKSPLLNASPPEEKILIKKKEQKNYPNRQGGTESLTF